MEEFNKNRSDVEIETNTAPVKQNCYYEHKTMLPDIVVGPADEAKIQSCVKPPKTQFGLVVFVVMLVFVALVSAISLLTVLFGDNDAFSDTPGTTTSSVNQDSSSLLITASETCHEFVDSGLLAEGNITL